MRTSQFWLVLFEFKKYKWGDLTYIISESKNRGVMCHD
jgi:hypothetical protein